MEVCAANNVESIYCSEKSRVMRLFYGRYIECNTGRIIAMIMIKPVAAISHLEFLPHQNIAV